MKQMRNTSIIFCIFLLVAFLAVSISHCYAQPTYKVEEGKIEKKLEKCKVNITYPIIEGCSDKESQDKVNRIFKDYAEKLQKEFLDTYEKEKKDIDAERKWDLTTIYETKEKSDVLCVVMFSGEYTGGAHPNPSLATFVYSMSKSKLYSLKDLFKPGSKYLEKISKFCAKEITARKISDEKWINEGTAPKEENYQFFYLNNKGVVIIFPQYQVAPYSEGNQEVTIPYSDLKDIMNADAPIVK